MRCSCMAWIATATLILLAVQVFGGDVAGIQWNEKDGKYVSEAGELLVHCLGRSTGTAPLIQSVRGNPHIQLVVRNDGHADPESFRLEFPERGKVVISGASPLAVRHGVCEFLERFYGVRWLMPGEDGEVVPEGIQPVFPDRPIVMSPHYLIRTFALSHGNKSHYEWAAHNRGVFSYDFKSLPNRPWFQHNLSRLLPPEQYKVTHPEFFPVLDASGARFLPEDGYHIYWQYCFTAPGLREALTEAIQASFQMHPEFYTVALGVNDGGRFCRCENCMKVDGPAGKDSMNHDRRALAYLECMDAVVRQCFAPGRTFGFLAYHQLRTPPEGRVFHPSLIPFLTYEKTYWSNASLMREDQELTAAWNRCCGSCGWYDYLFYRNFLIPKISLKALPSALKWGAANHVKYYYAEAFPADDWHTGPMMWLILKLTWDSSLDVDALLKDWCVAAVGAEAAVHLEKYYRDCSDFWEKSVPTTDFFREHRQYLPFGSSHYLEPLTQEWLDTARGNLQKTVELASSDGKKRAERFLQGFLKRESEMLLYLKNNQLQKQAQSMKFKVVETLDFDNGTGLNTWQRKTSKGIFYHAGQEGMEKSGAAAMKLKNSLKDMAYLQNFKVKPGAVYRVTAYVRTVGTDASCVVGLRASWSAPGSTRLNPAYDVHDELKEDASFEWRKLSVVVSAPNIEKCKMMVLLSARNSLDGEVYFDNLTVEEALPVQ